MNYFAVCARENLCVDWRIKVPAITFSIALGLSATAVACLDSRRTNVWPVEVSWSVNPRREFSAADGVKASPPSILNIAPTLGIRG